MSMVFALLFYPVLRQLTRILPIFILIPLDEICKKPELVFPVLPIMTKPTQRTCPWGHVYYKSSDCPACPQCEAEKRPAGGFLSRLGAPARRALHQAGIDSLEKLSAFSEKEILLLHGMGKASLPVLREELARENRAFRND